METIKVTCLLCKQEFIVGVEQICWPCSPQYFLEELEKEFPEKKFWKNAKEFSLWAIIYVPIAMIICYQFGFGYEMAWIGGGVFIQLLPPFHRWLLSKM